MTDLFRTGKCDLPAVPKLDFRFVEGCEVQSAPPPINDCPSPEIAFTGIAAPADCVSISARGSLTLNRDEPPSVNILVTREQIAVPGLPPRCLFTLDIDLNVPVTFAAPCAAFSMVPDITEQRSITVPVFLAEVSTVSLSSIGCKHEISLEVKLPDRRIYPGVITGGTGCSTRTVQTQAPGPVWNVTANIWLRNCCNGSTLTNGKKVWITLTDFGWGIIATEEILIVPVELQSAMVAGEATAAFCYSGAATGTAFTVLDPMGLFKCAFEGARGFAICNDYTGVGEWELVSCEQYALWIQFRVGNPGTDPFDNVGPINVFLVEHHNGAQPPLTSLKLEVMNPLDFRSSVNRLGMAMRRDDCGYDVWQVQCSIGGGGE